MNALLMYLSLEKLTSISPWTLTFPIMKTFSSEKLFENGISENIAVVKMTKIYSLNVVIKFLDIKIILHEKTYNTYKKSGVNMATADS